MSYIITAWRPSELGERGRTWHDYIEDNILMDSMHIDIHDADEANEMAKALTLIGWDVMVESLDTHHQFSIEPQFEGGPFPVPVMVYTLDAEHSRVKETIIKDAIERSDLLSGGFDTMAGDN